MSVPLILETLSVLDIWHGPKYTSKMLALAFIYHAVVASSLLKLNIVLANK